MPATMSLIDPLGLLHGGGNETLPVSELQLVMLGRLGRRRRRRKRQAARDILRQIRRLRRYQRKSNMSELFPSNCDLVGSGRGDEYFGLGINNGMSLLVKDADVFALIASAVYGVNLLRKASK